MEKLNVAVIFGGHSSEYSVSLESAGAVISNLDTEKYHAVPVGITKEGDWFYFKGDPAAIRENTWHNKSDCTPAALSPNRSEHCLMLFEEDGVKKLAGSRRAGRHSAGRLRCAGVCTVHG